MHPLPYMEIISQDGLKKIDTRRRNSVFRYKAESRFIHLEHENTDSDGQTRFLNTYFLPGQRGEGLFAAINIDWPMSRVFEVSVTRSLMMFRIENNYPTVAEGLKGKWAPSAGIIVTLFPGSKKLHWMLFVSNPGVEFSELSSSSKLEKFLGEEDDRNTSYGKIFRRGHSISQEAFDDSLGSYAKAALRGAVGGFLWWGEDEAFRKKMRREVGYNWDKFLSAVESSDIKATSKAANEIGRIGINIFSPYFFTRP